MERFYILDSDGEIVDNKPSIKVRLTVWCVKTYWIIFRSAWENGIENDLSYDW